LEAKKCLRAEKAVKNNDLKGVVISSGVRFQNVGLLKQAIIINRKCLLK